MKKEEIYIFVILLAITIISALCIIFSSYNLDDKICLLGFVYLIFFSIVMASGILDE